MNRFAIVPIESISQHPRNPRCGDVAAICSSIEMNGFYGAILVQRSSNRIVAGNHRWLAAKQSGATEIPIVYVDCSDEQADKILIADNRIGDLAEMNDASLLAVLDALAKDGGLAGTGYTDVDYQLLMQAAMPADTEAVGDSGDPDPGMGRIIVRVGQIVVEVSRESYESLVSTLSGDPTEACKQIKVLLGL